jgi:hypothetical protein
MGISVTFLLNGGLFDFDLTFLAEGILFLLFSLVVTFVFLVPVGKQLENRSEFIDFNLRKSTILLMFGSQKLSNCLELLTNEISELNRQLKLTKNYTVLNFENEIAFVQKENGKLLSKLKGELSIKSAYFFANLVKDLGKVIENFFSQKFQS